MERKVRKYIEEHRMLALGDRVVVGLSGGADSVALLFCLLSLREEWNLSVYACHVNHMIRGEEAERDEAFVRSICQEQQVPLEVLRADVPAAAKERHESTETVGRDIRYDFFRSVSESLQAKIATAHTASDNVETVLFNMTRGTGLHGLCGIPPVRGQIIRPLLVCTREEIEAYCRTKGLSYVEDSTNFSDDYARNRIRHEVISQLKRINPALESSVAQMTDNMRRNALYLYREACRLLKESETAGGYQAKTLYTSDPALFAEAMRVLSVEWGIIPEARHIRLLRQICENGGAVQIGKGVTAICSQGIFRMRKEASEETDVFLPITEEMLASGCSFVIGHKIISLNRRKLSESDNGKKITNYLFHSLLNYDTIPMVSLSCGEPVLCLRTRLPGDTFQSPHSRVRKKLRRLMMERKIPSELRSSVLLLAHGTEVLWGEYIGSSDRCAVTATAECVLSVTVEELSSS